MWIYNFCFTNYCFSTTYIFFFLLGSSRKVLKDWVIPSLQLPEGSMQRWIFKPCVVTKTSFYSSSGSKLFTSSSTQSEKKQKKTYKDFKEFCQLLCNLEQPGSWINLLWFSISFTLIKSRESSKNLLPIFEKEKNKIWKFKDFLKTNGYFKTNGYG